MTELGARNSGYYLLGVCHMGIEDCHPLSQAKHDDTVRYVEHIGQVVADHDHSQAAFAQFPYQILHLARLLYP
jgi:hypothetical protein